MELNIIKQIKELRNQLRRTPKDVVEAKEVKRELSKLRPVLKRKEMGRPPIVTLVGMEMLTLKEIAQRHGLEIKTVRARYKAGNRGKLLIRPSQKTYNRTPKDDLTNIV
jgi:DNA-directed RNA polymerase specialized sigma24 family protein